MNGWRDEAACAGASINVFFKDGKLPDWSEARALCASCPVKGACLRDALETECTHVYGFRGGMAPAMRRKKSPALRRQMGIVRPPAPIPHGTVSAYRRCLRTDDGPCDACREANSFEAQYRRPSRAAS